MKYYVDVTPQLINYNNSVTELGMVRYEIDAELLAASEILMPHTFFVNPVPIDSRSWAKMGFKVELRWADVPQPTPIDVVSAYPDSLTKKIQENSEYGKGTQ